MNVQEPLESGKRRPWFGPACVSEDVVDFSDPYCFGSDGILARSDSTITAGVSVADLAKRRVAVQRGSPDEKALQNTVI